MIRGATMVQHIMTEFNGAVSEEAKIVDNTKIVLNLMKQMTTRFHKPLKVITFNANGIGRQRYELSKQLQDLHTDVALFSYTHLKPHDRFFIPNYYFY
jgi:hypothetical protein